MCRDGFPWLLGCGRRLAKAGVDTLMLYDYDLILPRGTQHPRGEGSDFCRSQKNVP